MSAGLDAKAGGQGNESLALQEVASHQSGLDVGMGEEVHALHRPGPGYACGFCSHLQLLHRQVERALN